jgi:hypothetical protein
MTLREAGLTNPVSIDHITDRTNSWKRQGSITAGGLKTFVMNKVTPHPSPTTHHPSPITHHPSLITHQHGCPEPLAIEIIDNLQEAGFPITQDHKAKFANTWN